MAAKKAQVLGVAKPVETADEQLAKAKASEPEQQKEKPLEKVIEEKAIEIEQKK